MPDKVTDKTARELFAPAEAITTTRDRLTATALDMFYEHGFHAVGLDAVIREVGVTKTTFYNHFESKDDLIVAAIAMRDRWENASIERAVEHFTDGTPRGRILAFFDVLDFWFNGDDYKGCLFVTACAEFPSSQDPVHQAAAAHFSKVTAVLEDLCRQAGATDPATLAPQIELLLQGAVVTRLIKSDDGAARDARAIAATLLDRHCPGSAPGDCHS